jgi:hypothetical protein
MKSKQDSHIEIEKYTIISALSIFIDHWFHLASMKAMFDWTNNEIEKLFGETAVSYSGAGL